jgi:type IV pilus assembly protein PilV
MKRTVRKPGRRGQGGFTIIELMIALTILLIGITGILSMQLTSMKATSYSRHATEASVLAEDLMEELRTLPITDVVNGSETVDAQGNFDAQGIFTRTWTVATAGTLVTVTVTVSWNEHGNEPHAIVLRTQRQQ